MDVESSSFAQQHSRPRVPIVLGIWSWDGAFGVGIEDGSRKEARFHKGSKEEAPPKSSATALSLVVGSRQH